MSAAAKAIASLDLKRRALSLGAVKAFDHALQFLLPVVLVRSLDTATFGEYRLLWLALGTVMAFAPLNMPGSLFFFVPRSEPGRRRRYVHNTMLFLLAAGVVGGIATGPWNGLLPEAVAPLEPYGALVPLFVAAWIAAVLLDVLPTVDERIGWQAAATVGVSLLRTVLVGTAAWVTGDLRVMLWVLVATALVKLVVLALYVQRHHGLRKSWFERGQFSEQFRHAAPFGASNALYALRGQADQWVAASLFALSSFAAFSIAAIVSQVVLVFRHAVLDAFLPSMSRLQASGDLRGMMEMNARGNVLVANALFPLLAFTFAFAEDIVAFIYTAAYLEAAPAMRVYIVGMVALVVEVGSVVLLLRQGVFALWFGAIVLVVAVAVSWSAAQHVGLAGAAAGSVCAVYLDRFIMLRRVSRLTGIGLGALQNWRELARAALFSVLAAAAAWAVVEPLVEPVLWRLVLGAALIAAVYGAAQFRRLRA